MKLTLCPYISGENCSGSNLYNINVIPYPGCTISNGSLVQSSIVQYSSLVYSSIVLYPPLFSVFPIKCPWPWCSLLSVFPAGMLPEGEEGGREPCSVSILFSNSQCTCSSMQSSRCPSYRPIDLLVSVLLMYGEVQT